MDRLEFLSYRIAFSGFPFGELQQILTQVERGRPWVDSCRQTARKLRGVAQRAEGAGHFISAAQAWQWTACAYHAASFCLHLESEREKHWGRILRLRQLARMAYLRALRSDPRFARLVRIPCVESVITGYLRLAGDWPSPVVMLFNGLDSVCEVEMHAFGSWLLSRGLSVLSLDLPACLSSRPRRPHFAVEELAPALAEWVAEQPRLRPDRIGAFGVSFGGHLVARALAGDARFRAGVAVSPAAWLGAKELGCQRVRAMLALTFDLHNESEIQALASQIHVQRLAPPRGRLLLYSMERDEVFGPEHVQAYLDWGSSKVHMRTLSAEHVGTSLIHFWLPEACDWLSRELAAKEVCAKC